MDSGIGRSKNAKYGDTKLNIEVNKYNKDNEIPLEYHSANFPRIKISDRVAVQRAERENNRNE